MVQLFPMWLLDQVVIGRIDLLIYVVSSITYRVHI